MNRWVVLILMAALGLKLASGMMFVSAHHDMDGISCAGAACEVAAGACIEHCLSASQTDTALPAITPLVLLLVVIAVLGVGAVIISLARFRAHATGLAPPGLVFVRNTILRE